MLKLKRAQVEKEKQSSRRYDEDLSSNDECSEKFASNFWGRTVRLG